MIRLTDEESRKEEDKSYKIWERDGGNLGIIRRQLVAKAQLKKVVGWGDEPCSNSKHSPPILKKKRICPECWQALLKEAE